MSEKVQTIFDSDAAEAEAMALASKEIRLAEETVMEMAEIGKRLIYAIGENVQQLKRAKVKERDILVLLPPKALGYIKLAAPVELLQGRGRLTLFGCRVGINKQNDRIFVGQEVKV
ncbi:MAG: hypothetical protein IKC97_01735 [Clostridia bacterium]|nr:hypothetical protein [Clostridia bacterium]